MSAAIPPHMTSLSFTARRHASRSAASGRFARGRRSARSRAPPEPPHTDGRRRRDRALRYAHRDVFRGGALCVTHLCAPFARGSRRYWGMNPIVRISMLITRRRVRCRGRVGESGMRRVLDLGRIRVEQLERPDLVRLHLRRIIPAMLRIMGDREAVPRSGGSGRRGRRAPRSRSDPKAVWSMHRPAPRGVRFTVVIGRQRIHQEMAALQPMPGFFRASC